jgi:hypothetical protein
VTGSAEVRITHERRRLSGPGWVDLQAAVGIEHRTTAWISTLAVARSRSSKSPTKMSTLWRSSTFCVAVGHRQSNA